MISSIVIIDNEIYLIDGNYVKIIKYDGKHVRRLDLGRKNEILWIHDKKIW